MPLIRLLAGYLANELARALFEVRFVWCDEWSASVRRRVGVLRACACRYGRVGVGGYVGVQRLVFARALATCAHAFLRASLRGKRSQACTCACLCACCDWHVGMSTTCASSLLRRCILCRLSCVVFSVSSLLCRLYCVVYLMSSVLCRLSCVVFLVPSILCRLSCVPSRAELRVMTLCARTLARDCARACGSALVLRCQPSRRLPWTTWHPAASDPP